MTRLTVFFLALLLTFTTQAQLPVGSDAFSKNRVQYKRFDWKYLATANFEVHFYGADQATARLTAQIAEEEYFQLTRVIGFSPYNKVKIFLYHSVSDLQQSNLGEADQNFSLGGQTNFNKSVVELAYTGQRSQYRTELIREITDALLFEMMYGGNLKETLQSSYLLSLPEWFIAGASAYVAEGWGADMDDFVRTHITSRQFGKPDVFRGEEAAKIGHSLWNYMAAKYGRSAVANVLNLTRIVRNERAAIQNSLGVPYDLFIKQWRNFYAAQYKQIAEQHLPLKESQLLRKPKDERKYHQVKLSPDGTQVAYSENYRGWYRVWVEPASSSNNKREKAFRGGHYVINQKINEEMPLLDWRDNQTLVMLNRWNGQLTLWFYDLAKQDERKESFDYFDNVESFSLNEKGTTMILSAERKGQSDIFAYDLARKKITQRTDDIFDDVDPAFLPSGTLVFSSNRPTDSTSISADFFNLYFLDQQNKTTQVTNFASDEVQPLAVSTDHFVYLSDQRGIKHLFRYDFSDQTSHQLTNFLANIQQYDIAKNTLVTVQETGKTGEGIFVFPKFDLTKTVFTGKTSRQQFLDRVMLQKIRKEKPKETEKKEEKAEEKPAEQEEKKEKKKEGIDTDDYEFDTFESTRSEPRPTLGKKEGKTDKKKETRNQNTLTSNGTRSNKTREIVIAGPYRYESLFSFDRSVISPYIDPIQGLGLLLEVGMADDLEHHRMDVGIFYPLSTLSLKNSRLFAQYRYLKGRIDYGARYERLTISLLDQPTFIHRYTLNKFEVSATYPLNVVSRVTVSPFIANTIFRASSEINPIVQTLPDQMVLYSGISGEFVLDNTIIQGPNIRTGSSLKAELTQYFGMNRSGRGFGNILVDARHYRRLLRGVHLATRLSYGQFYGQNSQNKQYRIGGVSNWLFQQEEDPGPEDPFVLNDNDPEEFRRDLSDILFLQYATPLRGFDHNKLSGNNFLVFNAEIRIPLIEYLNRRTIRSKFFQNLQLVGFTDIGSAWTGISPFNRENALNTIEVSNGPFDVRVSNFKDPFLVGYGFGLRSKIFNYFTRFDVAWGLENDVVQPVQFYLSLGYDF